MRKEHQKASKQFVGITFLLTWFLWGLASFGISTGNINTSLITAGTFVPSLTGLFMAYKGGGLDKFKRMIQSTLNPKIGALAYVYILGVTPLIMVLSYLVLRFLEITVPTSEFPYTVFFLVFGYVLVFLGPLGEEIGWRGFLLDKMLHQLSPFLASLRLGIIWSLWHIPLFFISSTLQFDLASRFGFLVAFGAYTLYTSMITLQITILYLISNRSVFAAILFHAMANASLGMMPLIASTPGAITLIIIMIIITSLLVVVYKERLFEVDEGLEKVG